MKKFLLISILAFFLCGMLAVAASRNMYLWHDGIPVSLSLKDILIKASTKMAVINKKNYPLDQVDSITFEKSKDTPAPGVPLRLNLSSAHALSASQTTTNTYRITTTDADPYISTTPLTKDLPADSCVLTFEYTLNERITHFEIFFAEPLTATRAYNFGILEATGNLWSRASFDMGQLRDEFEWGYKGDYLRLDPGDGPGTQLTIRNMYLRKATPEEIEARKHENDKKQFIDNGIVRLGVDMERGGSVFSFALSENHTNLLNHYDEGRFVQQSYYGEPDGSRWNGQNWSWNPIQGGGCNGTKAQVKSAEINESSLRIVSTPVHWAYSYLMPELEMEEIITLEGNIGHIHYIFRNTGAKATNHPSSSHEMPAIFVDAAYQHLKFYKGSKPWEGEELQDTIPGWPNEYQARSEEWAAYVNSKDYGIGVYTPGSPNMTTYRFGSGNATGPKGGDCSYFAPLRRFAIMKGMTVEYDVYLTIGDIKDIRSRFYEIHEELFPNWREELAEASTRLDIGYDYQNNITVKDETDGSRTLETVGGDPYISTTGLMMDLTSGQNTLVFEYKSNTRFDFEIFFSPIQAGRSMTFSLAPTSSWTTKRVDISKQRKNFGWGSYGDFLRLDLGGASGTILHLKNMHVE